MDGIENMYEDIGGEEPRSCTAVISIYQAMVIVLV